MSTLTRQRLQRGLYAEVLPRFRSELRRPVGRAWGWLKTFRLLSWFRDV
jgi:hypothetical protein